MSRFTVFLDGDMECTERLKSQILDTRFIAADGGIRHAVTCEVFPELWVGDFDSCSSDLIEKFSSIPRLEFPSCKEKTDGELAIDECLCRGAKFLILIGAFAGKRIDHVLFHFACSLKLVQSGIGVLLSSGFQEAVPLLPGRHEFNYPIGTKFSIIPFSPMQKVFLFGGRWVLDGCDLSFGSSCTLSNEVRGILNLSFQVGSGILVVFFEKS